MWTEMAGQPVSILATTSSARSPTQAEVAHLGVLSAQVACSQSHMVGQHADMGGEPASLILQTGLQGREHAGFPGTSRTSPGGQEPAARTEGGRTPGRMGVFRGLMPCEGRLEGRRARAARDQPLSGPPLPEREVRPLGAHSTPTATLRGKVSIEVKPTVDLE